jgi:hypothetical protein
MLPALKTYKITDLKLLADGIRHKAYGIAAKRHRRDRL